MRVGLQFLESGLLGAGLFEFVVLFCIAEPGQVLAARVMVERTAGDAGNTCPMQKVERFCPAIFPGEGRDIGQDIISSSLGDIGCQSRSGKIRYMRDTSHGQGSGCPGMHHATPIHRHAGAPLYIWFFHQAGWSMCIERGRI